MARYPKVDPRDLTGLLRKLDEDPFAHGSATEIWRGTWKGPPPAGTHSGWIAIKVIRTASAPDRAEELCRKLKREARLWASLKDPNIVPLLGVVFDMTPSNVPSLVSPYYKNGNLKSYMNQHRTELSSLEMLKMTYQFASGLAYLHKVGVVHGDLKPDNVMIGDNREVVVSDFGLSLALETAGFTTKNFYGSVRYTAPELLGFAGVSGSGQFVPKTANGDIWAFAITSTEIFSSKPPYHNLRTDSAVLVHVNKKGHLNREDYKREISESLWSVFSRCWHYEPSQRPRMLEVKLFLINKVNKYRVR